VTINQSSQQQIAEALFPELADHCIQIKITVHGSGTNISAQFHIPSKESSERLTDVATIVRNMKFNWKNAA